MFTLISEKGSDGKLCELPASCLFFKKSSRTVGIFPGGHICKTDRFTVEQHFKYWGGGGS